MEITVGLVGLLRIACRGQGISENSKPFFRKFSKKVTRGHRTGEAIEIEADASLATPGVQSTSSDIGLPLPVEKHTPF